MEGLDGMPEEELLQEGCASTISSSILISFPSVASSTKPEPVVIEEGDEEDFCRQTEHPPLHLHSQKTSASNVPPPTLGAEEIFDLPVVFLQPTDSEQGFSSLNNIQYTSRRRF